MLDELVKWLVFETPLTASTVEVLHGFAQRLCGAGGKQPSPGARELKPALSQV